ncbi:MAG: leucine-rich repeat domain-containing protein [Candidatus Wallbacteria bacterium]|nr:leucine-rich repeat domain-containing protein [Candidatus Wallbacteria bacterium]
MKKTEKNKLIVYGFLCSLPVIAFIAFNYLDMLGLEGDKPKKPKGIQFEDKEFREIIKSFIRSDEKDPVRYHLPIYPKEVNYISRVTIEDKKVTSIGGLEFFTGLEEVDISGTFAKNLTPLEKLLKLRSVIACRVGISDISSIGKILSLQSLQMAENEISDLTPLSTLINLSTLVLNNNRVKDLKPISALTGIKTLNLEHNDIVDVSPLLSLTNLEILNLGFNQITDASALLKLPNLRQLYLNNNQIKDLTSLIKALGSNKNLRIALEGNPLNTKKQRAYIQGLKQREYKISYY